MSHTIDPERMNKAVLLADCMTLVIVATGLLGITAWFTEHPVLFYVTTAICTVATLLFVGGMLVLGFGKNGGGYIPIAILLLIIGFLVTHGVLPGILLGVSFFGLYAMGPIAYHHIRANMLIRARNKEQEKLDETRDKLFDMLKDDGNRDDRIDHMSSVYDRLSALVETLLDKTDELHILISDIEKVKDYLASRQWQRDREVDLAGAVPPEINRSVLSKEGMTALLRDLDGLCDQFDDLGEELSSVLEDKEPGQEDEEGPSE